MIPSILTLFLSTTKILKKLTLKMVSIFIFTFNYVFLNIFTIESLKRNLLFLIKII